MASEPDFSDLSEKQAATLLGIPAERLRHKRQFGAGPRHSPRNGGNARYSFDDLARWHDDRPMGSAVTFNDFQRRKEP